MLYALCLILCLFSLTHPSFASQTQPSPAVQEVSQAMKPPAAEQPPSHPIGIDVDTFAAGRAKGKKEAAGHKIGFQQAAAKLQYRHELEPSQSLLFGLGYEHTHLHLTQNPYFQRKNFGYIPFFVGLTTTQYDRWVWQMLANIKVDSQRNKLRRYSQTQLQVRGRYAYSDQLGLHVGAIAQFGIKKPQLLPIFGVDYAPSKVWRIKAIFPAKLAVNYRLDAAWSWELSGRLLQTRHRLSNREPLKEGIFDYRLYGTDLALQYHPAQSLLAQVYAGWGFGSKLKIYDRSRHLFQSYRFKPAPYVGLMLQYQF